MEFLGVFLLNLTDENFRIALSVKKMWNFWLEVDKYEEFMQFTLHNDK